MWYFEVLLLLAQKAPLRWVLSKRAIIPLPWGISPPQQSKGIPWQMGSVAFDEYVNFFVLNESRPRHCRKANLIIICTGLGGRIGTDTPVCCPHSTVLLFFLLVDIQHNSCPRWFFILSQNYNTGSCNTLPGRKQLHSININSSIHKCPVVVLRYDRHNIHQLLLPRYAEREEMKK